MVLTFFVFCVGQTSGTGNHVRLSMGLGVVGCMWDGGHTVNVCWTSSAAQQTLAGKGSEHFRIGPEISRIIH